MSLDDWIKAKIEEDLSPVHFEVINESHKHAGHAGDDGSGETHYKLIVVSDCFEGVGRIERQRLVNSAMKGAFDRGLHALSIKALAPDEYSTK